MKPIDQQIKAYLDDLKAALKGTDKAVIQDALADAEEHLRTALAAEAAEHPKPDQKEILKKIIKEYGSPEEIAEAYRSWETGRPAALAAPPSRRPTGERPEHQKHPGFLGVFGDPLSWGGLVYMLISLITGTLYFSWTVTALSTSLGLMILIIGIPVTILFLLSIRGLAFLEGRLVEALLGERMPRRPAFTDPTKSWSERLKDLLLGRETWLSIIYLLLMLPMGIFYFSLSFSLLVIGLALIASPLLVWIFNVPITFVNNPGWVWQYPDWATPLAALAGFLLITLTMHLARGVGRLHSRFAKALLVSD